MGLLSSPFLSDVEIPPGIDSWASSTADVTRESWTILTALALFTNTPWLSGLESAASLTQTLLPGSIRTLASAPVRINLPESIKELWMVYMS